jgi:hypothetical protein
MSFLDTNSSEYLSARITQKGRNAIASGNFNISYFSIGDSEFEYSSNFSGMTGGTLYQSVFTPFDKNSDIKYPIKYDNTDITGTTIYGIPISQNSTEVLRNAMGPAGFVSEYSGNTLGSTIPNSCPSYNVAVSNIIGTNTIIITGMTVGDTYENCEYITLVFNGTKLSGKVITGNTNSDVYKIQSVSGLTSTSQKLTLDRNTVNLSGLTGNAKVICNKCEVEFIDTTCVSDGCLPNIPNNESQHNPWRLNTIWGVKPIGLKTNTRDLNTYKSNKYVGIKDLLGYTSTNQTFVDYTGGTIDTPTSFINSFGEKIEVLPSEQNSIAIIHFSEIGHIVNDPDRFFKYDEYISHTGNTSNYVATDYSGTSISDSGYFQIYLPFLLYHKNTGSTIGALFTMDSSDYYVKSTINNFSEIKFRYLLDTYGNKVGKVFVNNKVIVFDDQEIVATLDYKSNRKYTLPSPKISTTNSFTDANSSLLSGNTGQTVWITYYFENTKDPQLNSLPCQYINKITGVDTPSNVILKFQDEFKFMKSSMSQIGNGYVGYKFWILVQSGTGSAPTNNGWLKIDKTSEVTFNSNLEINPVYMTADSKMFTINRFDYNDAVSNSRIFDLTQHMSQVMTFTGSTESHFGDEQPFPGSVKLVRASEIEEMNFLVNLPSGKFSASQKPNAGVNPMITEVALLNSNKDVLVIGKTSKPIKRIGTQVFAIKLDF